jgi:predicted nuclease of predicted toxin-antitoxin system
VKLLLDTCVCGGAKAQLAATGHDVVWAGDKSQDPGDQVLLQQAAGEKRVLVTLDKDFGELAVFHNIVHAGIIRLAGFRSVQQAGVSERILAAYGKELAAGALITVEPGRVRIRPASGA